MPRLFYFSSFGYFPFMREYHLPRIVISAQKGGAGKTLFALGLVAALKKLGHLVIPFKKGPDYIDAGWLSFAAAHPCYNLDPFFMPQEVVRSSFLTHASPEAVSVIEGNRGLLDGVDSEGSCSTAQLARILKAPVVLVLDATKVTRSLAAFVKGCQVLEEDLSFAGVVLNQIVRARHERIITESLEKYTGLKVVGVLPRLKNFSFPMRHLGLLPWQEHGEGEGVVETLARVVLENVDVSTVKTLADKAPPLLGEPIRWPERERIVRIGVFRDAAFQFYYPENLSALNALGAELVYLNALSDRGLPSDLDALYIGGGFPETQAEALADNFSLRKDLNSAIEDGLPVYAECGGLMYLGGRIFWQGRSFEMVGALPMDFEVRERPQGHGYVKAAVVAPNPFYPLGLRILGHEFHYSCPVNVKENVISLALKLEKGHGFAQKMDGVVYRNVFGAYTHLHVLGQPLWAEALIRAALRYKEGNRGDLREVVSWPEELLLSYYRQTKI